MRRESGFTLIEVLVVILISSILLTLSATAVRRYWFASAIESSAEEIVAELRSVQQRTIAASHPMVYGAWFREGPASDQWGVLRYDPKDPSSSDDDVCTQVASANSFGDGVVVSAANFQAAGGTIEAECGPAAPPGAAVVFFYARGSATPGQITLFQAELDQEVTITVSGVTGRVEQQ